MQKFSGLIHEYPETTGQRLFYVIYSVSKSVGEYLPIAVYSLRSDVEAFTTDDPDIVEGSLTAQHETFGVMRGHLLDGAFEQIYPNLVPLLQVINAKP